MIVGKEQVRFCIKPPIMCSKAMGKKGMLNGWLGTSKNQENPKAGQNLPVEVHQNQLVEVSQNLPVENATGILLPQPCKNLSVEKLTGKNLPVGFLTFYR